MHSDVEVTFAGAVKTGHAFVLESEYGSSLGAGGDFDRGLAVERGDFAFPAECGGGEGDGDLAEEVVAFTFEEIMALDDEENVEIAGRATAKAGIAIARGAEACAGINTTGDAKFDVGVFLHASFATTGVAGIGDEFARAMAGGAFALLNENAC